jgi:hypothetical protein
MAARVPDRGCETITIYEEDYSHEQEPGRKEEHQEGAEQDAEGKERSQAPQESREKVLMIDMP